MSGIKEKFHNAMGNDYRGDAMFDEPLSKHTSLAIGGPAAVYVAPADAGSLKRCLLFAKEHSLPIYPLGGGTNVLVSDNGVNGMAISLKYFNMKKIIHDKDDTAEMFVESGVTLQALINFCVKKGYAGIEGLAGIPGMVGGAIIGNSGSYGQEIEDVITSIIVINASGMIRKLEKGEFSFGYRTSFMPEGLIVLGADMIFKKTDTALLRGKIAEYLSVKKSTQPLSERSAGCVFKNPEGGSAGRIIESTGCKGLRVGDIEVSGKHANFFINKGNGSASDFVKLMRTVQERVSEKTGINLQPEIRIIGDVY